MKKIHSFTINKEKITKKPILKQLEGKDVEVLEDVIEKEPHTFFIRKPSSTLTQDAEMYYNVQFWACVKNNILPRSQLQKRLVDDGGVLSKEDVEWTDKSYEKVFELQSELKGLTDKPEKTEDNKKRSEEIIKQLGDIITNIEELQQKRGGHLYQNTAEHIASERLLMWWMLHLSYEEIGDKSKEVFEGKTYEDKLAKYDELKDSNEEFFNELHQKLFLTTSIWSYGKANTPEEFDLAFKLAENKGLINAAQVVKEDKKEEVKVENK